MKYKRDFPTLPKTQRRDDLGPSIGTRASLVLSGSSEYATLRPSAFETNCVEVTRVPWDTAPPSAYALVVERSPIDGNLVGFSAAVLVEAFDSLWPKNAPHVYSAWIEIPPPAEVL